MHAIYQKTKLNIRAKQGTAFRCRNTMTDEALWHPQMQDHGRITNKRRLGYQFLFKTNNQENFTDDGWFKTGDVSTIDADGYMEIKDRTKDLIKVVANGFQALLESALMAHPKIREAAVIAIADENG
jgi:fatty-acyl-CoA synthase